MSETTQDWSGDVHRALADAGVRQVAYVPDSGLTGLIEACRADAAMAAVPLTSEEEGVALLAGAWLGGQRGVALMQSSGIGNCINMLSLTRVCGLPLLVIATMRGEEGETNPWQLPMGQNARVLLEHAGVEVRRADAPGDIAGLVAEAAHAAFASDHRNPDHRRPAAQAVLIGQAVIGVKNFED